MQCYRSRPHPEPANTQKRHSKHRVQRAATPRGRGRPAPSRAPQQQAAGAQVRVLGQLAAAVLAQRHERAQVLGRQRDRGRHGRLPHARHLDAQRELRPARARAALSAPARCLAAAMRQRAGPCSAARAPSGARPAAHRSSPRQLAPAWLQRLQRCCGTRSRRCWAAVSLVP